MVIREEQSTDEKFIRKITIEAFSDEPHSDHNEQEIIECLRRENALSVSLVAVIQGEVVGHVAISEVTIADKKLKWFGLGPISVALKFQRQGIGKELMKASIAKLKEQRAAGCVVLGDPQYYSKFGFKPELDLVFPSVPQEYFQSLLLSGNLPKGEVTYHKSFYNQG